MALLTLAISYLVAFSTQSQFPTGRTTESYALIALFGIAVLILVSQRSILKLLLGILVLENIGTLLIAWGANTTLFPYRRGVRSANHTHDSPDSALDFAEYGSIDSSKLTNLRG